MGRNPFDRLATVVFNEIYGDPIVAPARNLADIEKQGIPELVVEWETIRATLLRMPNEVLRQVCALRGLDMAAPGNNGVVAANSVSCG